MFRRRVTASAIIVCAAVLFFTGLGALYPVKYLDIIDETSAEFGLEPAFICAVIHAESRFRRDAVSAKGAAGLMQVMEATAEWAASELKLNDFDISDIFEPEINILIGCWYLNRLTKQFGDETDVVLAAYNAGSGNVSNWLESPQYSGDGKTLSHVPFGETRGYIQKVNGNLRIYNFLFELRKLSSRI